MPEIDWDAKRREAALAAVNEYRRVMFDFPELPGEDFKTQADQRNGRDGVVGLINDLYSLFAKELAPSGSFKVEESVLWIRNGWPVLDLPGAGQTGCTVELGKGVSALVRWSASGPDHLVVDVTAPEGTLRPDVWLNEELILEDERTFGEPE